MGNGLVKTVRFKNPQYVGDPINAVKILNDKVVDEIIFLDISENEGGGEKPNFDLLSDITSECFIPFTYGGGVTQIDDIKRLLHIGIEKVTMNSHVFEDPPIVEKAAAIFGSQSIVVSIDVRKNLFGRYQIYSHGGKKKQNISLSQHIHQVEAMGAGELMINSIDRDGTLKGYDMELIRMITQNTSIPVIACGGAGRLDDFKTAIQHGGASAAAAGSYFVYHGKHKAVLINYPTHEEITQLLNT
jgi:cyclase